MIQPIDITSEMVRFKVVMVSSKVSNDRFEDNLIGVIAHSSMPLQKEKLLINLFSETLQVSLK
jgi:hypothetical protein